MALVLSDQSQNTNDLTNVNGAIENTASTPFANSTSVADLELSSTQYFTAPNHASLQLATSVTLEAWVKPESLTGNHTIIGKGRANGDNSFNYGFRLDSSGKVQFVYASSGPTFHTWATTAAQASVGTWVHIAVTFTFGTGSGILCYINGTSVGGSWVQGNGNSAVLSNSEVLQLGCIHSVSGANELFDGLIDEVRIWSSIRTGTEITNNKAVELAGDETGLAAYYPFESLTRTKTITGLAKIVTLTTRTIIGVANIKNTTLQTITGKARITASVARTIAGIARIQKTTSQTISGLARIQKTASQTITGKARIIYILSDQTIAGLARIHKVINQTIAGLARIAKVISQTILGKANLIKVIDQTITGVAKITVGVSKTLTIVYNIDEYIVGHRFKPTIMRSGLEGPRILKIEDKDKLTIIYTK